MTKPKLANLMVRDPFVNAVERETKGMDPLLRAFKALGLGEEDRPLVVTPVNRSKRIIDAKADGVCGRCGQAVWMSPSSWRSRQRWTVIVCLECLEKAAGLPPFSDEGDA